MQLCDIRLKRTVAAVIRTMLMVALFTAAILFANNPAFAGTDTVLTVQKDGVTVKEFTLEELQQIASDEGDITYSFTAWNTYPTFKVYKDVHGPSVTGILDAAGIDPEGIQDTWTVTFADREQWGYEQSLTGKQLFEDRFYYPNGRLMDPVDGNMNDGAYSDAVNVPAVISTTEVFDESGEQVEGGQFKLYVGQVAPNEENNPLFVNHIAEHGYIKVSTEDAPKCTPVTADPENLTVWRAGKEITLTSKNNYEYDKIYYTFEEGAVPDYGSTIYNCGPKQRIELRPVIPSGVKRSELKVIVKGYGKQDSDLQKFVYTIGEPLTVKADGEILKTYDRDELEEIEGIREDAVDQDYSGYNSYPTLNIKHVNKGYRVDSIIKDATGKDVLEFDSSSTVRFTGSDGYSSLFTIGQLFGSERYYYPDAAKGTDALGGKARLAAYNGSIPVPAVIDSSRESQLMFGQIAPNEQNHSEFVSYMLQGGTIEINTAAAEKCEPVAESFPPAGSAIAVGEPVHFPVPDTYENRRDKIYYIIDPKDGDVPGAGCAFYYYAPYFWPEDKLNPPSFSTGGHHTIATCITAYGKQDSDVRLFDFYVSPPAPTGLKGVSASYSSVKLTWKALKGVKGYRIYRAKPGETLTRYKDIGPDQASYTNKGLVTGTTYRYAVAGLSEGPDKTLVGTRCTSIKVRPVPGKPTVTLTSSIGKIKVKWNRISGASGYAVMRSTKKSSGYKTVKTFTRGSTVTFTDTKVKKGTVYYYKVRAYRKVSGKKIYGSYSAVKVVRAK